MKKITVACDSFKGCLSSAAVNAAARRGIGSSYVPAQCTAISLADGGEGTVEAIAAATPGARLQRHSVEGPLGKNVDAAICLMPDGNTAIVETAAAAGITLVAESERNPLLTSTYGLGQQIRLAIEAGCRNIIVGLGGSATNDGGTGMLQALGFRFLDKDGNLIAGRGGQILSRIYTVDSTGAMPGLTHTHFTILCDVSNPLTGANGATYIFGPQKGAGPDMLDTLEAGMANYARALVRSGMPDVSDMPGAGAAGGLGAAFTAALGATPRPGIDTLLKMVNFDSIIADADLVITGEGRIDAQTLMGKAPKGILDAAQKAGVPVIAIAGSVDNAATLTDAGFAAVLSIQHAAATLSEAMDPLSAAQNIADTARQAVNLLFHSSIAAKQ